MKYLKFLNHASYFLESDKSILLFDPWYEGGAFNNGWNLYYQDISNKEIINYLKASTKQIFIWISHEHSDHFNIPFIKELKNHSIKIRFLFHKTYDRRVINYLKRLNFEVSELINGNSFFIDSYIKIKTWRFSRLDSFCLTNFGKINILNLNDCVVKTKNEANLIGKKIFNYCNNIDILFTQFGYADWVGRPKDYKERKNAAKEKLNRIYIQAKILNPKIIIPFASFIYFSKEDNYYLNSTQNGINEIRKSSILNNLQRKIIFMKPRQLINLDENYKKNLQKNNSKSELFWSHLIKKVKQKDIKIITSKSIDFKTIKIEGGKYIKRINKETFYISYLSELLNQLNIKKLKINIYDIEKSFSLSYVDGFEEIKNNQNRYDLKIHSNEINYIFKNDFGWNTVNISGALRVNTKKLDKITSFFLWQDSIKNGFSYKRPFYSLFIIFKFISKKFKNSN